MIELDSVQHLTWQWKSYELSGSFLTVCGQLQRRHWVLYFLGRRHARCNTRNVLAKGGGFWTYPMTCFMPFPPSSHSASPSAFIPFKSKTLSNYRMWWVPFKSLQCQELKIQTKVVCLGCFQVLIYWGSVHLDSLLGFSFHEGNAFTDADPGLKFCLSPAELLHAPVVWRHCINSIVSPQILPLGS